MADSTELLVLSDIISSELMYRRVNEFSYSRMHDIRR